MLKLSEHHIQNIKLCLFVWISILICTQLFFSRSIRAANHSLNQKKEDSILQMHGALAMMKASNVEEMPDGKIRLNYLSAQKIKVGEKFKARLDFIQDDHNFIWDDIQYHKKELVVKVNGKRISKNSDGTIHWKNRRHQKGKNEYQVEAYWPHRRGEVFKKSFYYFVE